MFMQILTLLSHILDDTFLYAREQMLALIVACITYIDLQALQRQM